MTDLIVDHFDAFALAQIKREESNLARCYLDAEAELTRLRDREKVMREALEWYASRARDLASEKTKNPDYTLAIVTELSLDAGFRASKALPTPPALAGQKEGTNLPTKAIEAAAPVYYSFHRSGGFCQAYMDRWNSLPDDSWEKNNARQCTSEILTAAAPFMGPRVRWEDASRRADAWCAYIGTIQVGTVLNFQGGFGAYLDGVLVCKTATLDLAKSAVEDAFAKAMSAMEGE